jgi:hypothetical protein
MNGYDYSDREALSLDHDHSPQSSARSRSPVPTAPAITIPKQVEFNVQTSTCRVIPVKVFDNETIGAVHRAIQLKGGHSVCPDSHFVAFVPHRSTVRSLGLGNGDRGESLVKAWVPRDTLYLMQTSYEVNVSIDYDDRLVAKGICVSMNVEASDTIDQVKAKLWDICQVPSAVQRISNTRNGTLLDERTLSSYHIQKGETLFMAYKKDDLEDSKTSGKSTAWMARDFVHGSTKFSE